MRSIGEGAVSEVVGAILLVSVAVLGVAIVAVTILSQPTPSEIPHVSIAAGATANGTFALLHEGGDALAEGDYRIYVDTGSGLEDRTDEFAPAGGGGWSIGESLVYTDAGMPERVVISAVDSAGGETVIAELAYAAGVIDPGGYMDVGGSGTVPAATVTLPPETGGNDSSIQITTPGASEEFVFAGTGHGNKHATMVAQTTLEDVTRVDFIVYRLDEPYNNKKESMMRNVQVNTSDYYVWDDIPALPGLSNGDKVAMIAIAYNGTEMIRCNGRVTTVSGL